MRPKGYSLLRMVIARPHIIFEVNSQWIGLSHLSTFFKIAKDLRKWSSRTFEKDISILTFSWDQKNNKCALTRFILRFFEGIAKVKTLRNVFNWSINGRMNAKNS